MGESNVGEQIDKLTAVLGFDPAKKPSATGELMKEVLEEVGKERREQAKARAKELLTKAMNLREEFARADKTYNDAKGKFQKELGKMLRGIEALTKGEEPPAEQDEVNKEEVK